MSDDPIVDLAVAAAPTAEPAPKDDFVADLYSTHVADPSAIPLSDLSSFGQYMGTGPDSPDSLLGGIFDAFARGARRVQTGFADTFAEWGSKNAAEYSDGLKSMMAFNQERYGGRGANWFERGLEDITFMAPTMLGTAALVALTPGVPDEAAGVAAIAKSWNAAKAMRLSQALTPFVIGTQTYGTRVEELRAMTGGRVSENDIAGMAAWGAYGIDGLLESIIPGEQIAGAVLGRAGSSVLGKWLKTATGREASKDLGRSIFGYPFVGGLKSLTVTLPAELLEEGVQGNADSLLKNYAMGERMDFGDAFARGLSDMYDAFPSVAMMSVMGAGLHAGKAEIQRKEVMDGVTGNDAPTPVQQSKIEALYGNDETLKGRDAAMQSALTELFGEQGTPDAKHAAVTLTQISRNLALQDRKAGNESAMPWDYVQGLSLSYLELSPSQRSTLKDLQNSGASNDQIYGFFAESSPTFAANVQSVHDRIDAIETEKANKGLRDDLSKALGLSEAQIDRTHRTLDIPLVSSKVEAEAKAEGIDLSANAVHMLSNVGVKRAIGNLEIAKTIMAKPLRLEIGGKGYTLKLNDDFSGLLIPETKTKKAKTATKVGDIDASQIAQGIQDAAQEARSALQAKVTARLGPVLGQGQIGVPTAPQTLVGKERATLAEAAANVPEGVKTPRNRLADAVAEQIYLNRRLSRVVSMGQAWTGISTERPVSVERKVEEPVATTKKVPTETKLVEGGVAVEGTEFNGVQKLPGEPDQHVYTDTQTKSTFYVPADATVEQVTAKRDEMRKKFEGEPVALSIPYSSTVEQKRAFRTAHGIYDFNDLSDEAKTVAVGRSGGLTAAELSEGYSFSKEGMDSPGYIKRQGDRLIFTSLTPPLAQEKGEGFKGMYLSDRALMVYFQNADASTFLHEWFHHLTVNRLLPASYEQALARSFGTPPEKEKGYIWSTQAHEDAANALLVYIRDGSIPENAPASLDEAFQYIKGVLQETQPTINAYQSKEALNTEGVNTLFANLVAETTPEQKAVADASMESLRSNPPSEADAEAIAELHEQLGPLAQEVNREQDARYLELAKDPEGNKAELQRMVEEAAKKAGYNGPWYHASLAKFNVYDLNAKGGADGTSARTTGRGGISLARTENGARAFVRRAAMARGLSEGDIQIYKLYAKTVSTFDAFNAEHRQMAGVSDDVLMMKYPYLVQENVDALKQGGFDSSFVNEQNFGRELSTTGLFVLEPSQIKSADPITYDDKGNVIPLSARFNPESPSILFQEVNEESKKAMRNFRSSLSNSARAMVAKMGGGNVKSLYDMGLDDKGEFNNDLFQYKLNLVKKNLAAQHRAVKPIRRALLKESEIAKEAASLTKTIKGDMDSAPDSVEEQAYQAGDGPRSWYWWMAQAKKPFRMLSKYFSTLETFAHFFSFSKQDSALYKLFWKDAEMDGRVIDEMNVERSMRDLKNLHILNGNDEVTLNGRKFRLTQAFDLYVAADGKRINESTDAFKKRVEKNMVKGWEQEDGESQAHYDERVNRDKKIYAILESNDMGDFRITGVEEFNDAVGFIGADKGLVSAMKYAQAEMGKMFDWVNDQIVGVYGEKSRLHKLPGMYSAQFREDGMGDPVEAVLDTLGMSNQAFIKGAQLPSSLKTRTNKAGGAPISLDFFGKYDRYMASMTNAGVRLPTVVKQLRVWSDQDLRKTVAQKFGYTKGASGGFHVPLWDRMGEAIVGSMRLSGRTMPPSEADNWLRENVRLPTSMATLGFKPWIALSQFLSTVSAMGEFDTKHIFRAMTIAKDALKYVGAQRWQANKDAMAAYRAGEKIPINDLPLKGMPLFEEMSKKLPSLRRMLGEWELIEAQMKMPNALDNFARKHGFGHNFMDVAFKEMKIADQINKLIIGATAYEQELEHQKAQGKSLAVAEAAAVDFAESLIRQHVPMASNILRTAFHNAPEAVRMLAPFSSQSITYFNNAQRNFILPFVQAYKLAEGNQMDKLGAAFGEVATKRNLQRAFYLFALPAILWNTLQRRRPPDKEEALWDVIMYPFSMIPIVGDVAAQARLQAQGVRPGEARIPGMIQWYDAVRMRDAITSLYKAAKGEDVNWEATWKNAVSLPADFSGLPKLLLNSPADIVKVDRMSKTDGEFAKNVISQFIFGGTEAKKSED